MNGIPNDENQVGQTETPSPTEVQSDIVESGSSSKGGNVAAGVLIPLFVVLGVLTALIVVKRKYFS